MRAGPAVREHSVRVRFLDGAWFRTPALVSECIENPSVFEGEKRFQWLCFVLDRKGGQVKPYFMPVTVYRQIEALQENPDYRFDEVPMPDDLTLNAKGAGTKEVVYTILPARANRRAGRGRTGPRIEGRHGRRAPADADRPGNSLAGGRPGLLGADHHGGRGPPAPGAAGPRPTLNAAAGVQAPCL